MNSENIISRQNRHGFNGIQTFINWWKYNDIGQKLRETLLLVLSCLLCLPIVALVFYVFVRGIYVLRWLLLGLLGLGVIFIAIYFVLQGMEYRAAKKREKEKKLQEEKRERREREEREWYANLMNTVLNSKEAVLVALDRLMKLVYADITEFYNSLPSELKSDTDIGEKCMVTIYNQEVGGLRHWHIHGLKCNVKEFYIKLPEKVKENKKIASEYINYAIPEWRINLNDPYKNSYIDDEKIRKCYEENKEEYKNVMVEFFNGLPCKIKNDPDIISLLKRKIVENFEIYHEYSVTEISYGPLVSDRHGVSFSESYEETKWEKKSFYDGKDIVRDIFNWAACSA